MALSAAAEAKVLLGPANIRQTCPSLPPPPRGEGRGGAVAPEQIIHADLLDWQDPAAVFAAFRNDPHLVWLDSQGESKRSRYSYLCVEPFEIHPGGAPFETLHHFISRFGNRTVEAPTPFAGGAAGFLGYESAAWLERVPRHDNPGVADAFIGFYDVVFAWDHPHRRFWILSNGLPETEPHAAQARALARTAAVLQRLAQARLREPQSPGLVWQACTPRSTHEARIARTIDYIRAGDIFQANITARFTAPRPEHLAASDIHLALRAANPAPYGAFLACGSDLAIASVSPERFVGLSCTGEIEARPIKGTRPRGADAAQDAALASTLLASGKDHAENLMIVDLLRNDISRVAQVGSVAVPELVALESFPHVHHLVSCITGTLRPGATAADLLRAAFPGGSISGAPKIRAMQIIHELEQVARGPYCGSIFWLGPDGAMDSSIAIRTATITRDDIIIQAGGGIVADSDPAEEYEEMLVKVRPLLRALGSFPQ